MKVGLLAVSLLYALDGHATHPRKHCDVRDRLVGLFTAHPHHERLALVLRDEKSGQGHRLELFMNNGEGGRHSYTLIRIRQNEDKACIVSAGLVGADYGDRSGCEYLELFDENDPDIYDLVTCYSYFMVVRTFPEQELRDRLLELFGYTALIASFGPIAEDNRARR